MTANDDYYAQATRRNLGIVNEHEQQTLRRARVAIPGLGGAGGIYLTTLVRMGIGHFHIADLDTFNIVNVNRQAGAMHSTVGRAKTEVMAALARDIHPGVEIKTFDQGIAPNNIDEFLRDVDVVVDALDVFAMSARLLLYRSARRLGKPVLFAAPLGLSATMGVFMPGGMSFEDYFDIHEGLTPFETLIAFIVGLAPAGTHWKYMDTTRMQADEHAGPSSAAALSLMAGMMGTEVLVVLLNRRAPLAVPAYSQFDPYLGVYRRGRLRWGNRGPLQRLKRWWVAKKFRAHAAAFNQANWQPPVVWSTHA